MNWRNVLRLLQVERKSGRLIRGIKSTRYRENKFIAYWPYWTALALGVLGGLGANAIAGAFYATAPAGTVPLSTEAFRFFAILPTLVLGISIVFTLLQQAQLANKASSQVMYWLPVTWQEHTLASILANLLGFPAAIVTGLAAGLLVFSAFNGAILLLQALLTIVVLSAAAFFASAITEIVRVLQVRFTGAVYKSSGRAAIWVRFITYLLIVAVLYIIYFYAIYGPGNFVGTLTAVQNMAWYVPFIWPALVLSYAAEGLALQSLAFAAASAILIAGLYYLAVELNKRFGLYEPPAITVQKSGFYAPKSGLLGKIGFPSVEAALIRKDLRAFTRRRELLSVYILPVAVIIVSLFNTFGITNTSSGAQVGLAYQGVLFLLPATGMAMLLGEILIGEEGQVMWRIYASPISAKNLDPKQVFHIGSVLSYLVDFVVGSGRSVSPSEPPQFSHRSS